MPGIRHPHQTALVNDPAADVSATAWNAEHLIDYNSLEPGRLAVSATDKLIGRATAGAGSAEEIALTAAGRALIAGATVAAQRTTLNVDRGTRVNVKDYGALGDGSTNDTAAIQAAINAARSIPYGVGGATLVFPAGQYVVASQLTIAPTSGAVVQLNIVGSGSVTLIWTGAAGASMIKSYGWKFSTIENITVVLNTTVAGVNVWDIDHDATRNSTAQLTWINCSVVFNSGATYCVAWRLGLSTTGAAIRDLAYMKFDNCNVLATDYSTVNIGWGICHGNALACWWVGGASGGLYAKYTEAIGDAGAKSGTMYFYGMSASNNYVEYLIRDGLGSILVSGGRYETGFHFILSDGAASQGSTAGHTITLKAVDIHSFAPPSGIMFGVFSPCVLVLDNCGILDGIGSGYTAALITLGGGATGKGAVIVRGGSIRAADPFWTISYGGWTVRVEDVVMVADIYGQALARFTPRNPDQATGTASITNGSTISHGLGRTPASATITPTVAKRLASITAKSSTTLTVSLHDDTGAAIAVAENVDWSAT